jgi:lipoprotein-releasing system ATP-binding protein
MNETATPRILGREIVKSFPSGEGRLEVLRGASLAVEAGEIVAVVGPSGSGKSTLLHCLGGLDRPDAGRIAVDGIELSELPESEVARVRNLRIGFVFQFHHLLPDFTALENVMLPGLIAGRSEGDARERARELLEWVGLSARTSHAPAELSGGEQQRVAVARALANRPAAILADEPSGNLDARTASDLHDLLTRLRDDRGASFVVATHDASLARRADRVLALEEGRLRGIDAAVWAEGAARRFEEARK